MYFPRVFQCSSSTCSCSFLLHLFAQQQQQHHQPQRLTSPVTSSSSWHVKQQAQQQLQAPSTVPTIFVVQQQQQQLQSSSTSSASSSSSTSSSKQQHYHLQHALFAASSSTSNASLLSVPAFHGSALASASSAAQALAFTSVRFLFRSFSYFPCMIERSRSSRSWSCVVCSCVLTFSPNITDSRCPSSRRHDWHVYCRYPFPAFSLTARQEESAIAG